MALLILIVVGIPIYLLPSIVAGVRGHHNAGAICVLNLLLGWAFLPWAIALVWSFTAVAVVQRQPGTPPPLPVIHGPEPRPVSRASVFAGLGAAAALVIVFLAVISAGHEKRPKPPTAAVSVTSTGTIPARAVDKPPTPDLAKPKAAESKGKDTDWDAVKRRAEGVQRCLEKARRDGRSDAKC